MGGEETEVDKAVKKAIEGWIAESQNDEDVLKQKLVHLCTGTVGAGDEESRPKRQKRSDDNIDDEALEGTRRANESLPKTLKEMALYIIDHCRERKELDDLQFIVRKQGGTKVSVERGDFKSTDLFYVDTIGYDDADFVSISFGERCYRRGKFDAEAALVKINSVIRPSARLVEEINRICVSPMERGDDIPKWEERFVVAADRSQLDNVNFPLDMSKGAALVVAGESGSGKSWFAKYFVPNKLGKDETAHIYYTLNDKDVKGLPVKKSENFRSMLNYACHVGMEGLMEESMHGTAVYESVSELSRSNNSARNIAAKELLKDVISKALEDSAEASAWWTAKKVHDPVKKLVVVVDEVGKAPELARGLVDEVRTIYADITNRGLAEKVLLVLVGSGLEHHIRDDTLEFEVNTDEDKEFEASMASFGTDPMKSNVIVLKGPDLERDTICGVATKDITHGTYSQVLATNTRMLTRGIIPIFQSKILTQYGTELSVRRVALGSTNIVMDYAARVYISLNGLQRLGPIARERVLLTQFRLFMCMKLVKLKSQENPCNPVFQDILNDLKPTREDFEKTLNCGLITADITTTSNALRYLACGGQTAPLDAQDGIAFEIILQHHLVRLSQARHDAARLSQAQDKNHFCGKYDLSQAWPPLSSKGDGKLKTPKDVEEELKTRYEDGCKEDDVTKIAALVRDKEKFDLVMRQTVSNAQGADVLVLSKTDAVISLDMYQAKHYKTIPGPSTRTIQNAFSSLGVAIVNGEIQTEPDKGAAGFSYRGTMHFAELLEKKLKMKVQIRNRVLVFSKEWQTFSQGVSWQKYDFEKAHEKKLMFWTKEMMEPTISALEYVAPEARA